MLKNLKKSFVKNKRLFISACAVFLYGFVILCASSCSENQKRISITSPLFSVTRPEYKSNTEDDRCKIGGVYFDFYNKADSAVVFMQVRMNVYENRGGNQAFLGQGTIVSDSEIVIEIGETKQMCIPLDEYITVVPKGKYFIDQFYVSRLEYEDGSVWKDEFGLYARDSGE